MTDQSRQRIVISANTSWNLVNFRSNLIRALQEAGHEVIAVSPPDAFSAQLTAQGIPWRPIEMDNKGTSPLKDFGLFLRYRKLLAELQPTAYLGYTIKPNVYGGLAARLCGARVIANISGLGTAFIRKTWLTSIVKTLYRVALARTQVVFFQNPEDRALFVAMGLVRAEQTRVLPGSGIDLTRFQPAPQPEGRADRIVFLLIARLLWDKGVREYAEAARIVRQKYPEAQFRIAGALDVENRTAVDRPSVERWVAEGVIDYLGAVPDIRPAIAEADCVVLPSYREGTPRTLLEAAAMARPVITTDVAGCREAVIEDETGFLCAVKDAQSLAEAMIRMVAAGPAMRAAFGQAGRVMAETRFDERIVIDAYLEALKR